MKDLNVIDFLCKDLKAEQIDFVEVPEVYVIKGKGFQTIDFDFKNDLCRIQRNVFSVKKGGYIPNLFFNYEVSINNYKNSIIEEYESVYYLILHNKDGIVQCDIIRKTKKEQEKFEKDVFQLFDVVALKKDVLNDVLFVYGNPDKKINVASIRNYYYDILMQHFGNKLRKTGSWTNEDRIVFNCPNGYDGAIAVEIAEALPIGQKLPSKATCGN